MHLKEIIIVIAYIYVVSTCLTFRKRKKNFSYIVFKTNYETENIVYTNRLVYYLIIL